MPANVKLTTEQMVKISIAPTNMTGGSAEPENEPVWTVESGDCTVEPEEGGLKVKILAPDDEIGQSIIKVKTRAVLVEGEDPEDVADLIIVDVVNRWAPNLNMTVGAPEPKEDEETGEGEDGDEGAHPDQTLPGDLSGPRSAKPGKAKPKKKR